MSSVELAVVEPDALATIESELPEAVTRAREALDLIATPVEAKDLADKAAAAEAYYKSLIGRAEYASRAYQETARVRLLAQRAIGKYRKEVPQSPGRRPHHFDWSEARRLREAGVSQTEVAKMVGVSQGSISRAERADWNTETPDGKRGFDKSLRIKEHRGRLYEGLADVDVETLEKCIAEAVDRDASLTARAIVIRAGKMAPTVRQGAQRRKNRERAIAAHKALLQAQAVNQAKARGDAIGRAFTLTVTQLQPELQAAYEKAGAEADQERQRQLDQCIARAHQIEDELRLIMHTR